MPKRKQKTIYSLLAFKSYSEKKSNLRKKKKIQNNKKYTQKTQALLKCYKLGFDIDKYKSPFSISATNHLKDKYSHTVTLR